MAELTFRYARKEDCGVILGFIKEMAVYEHMLEDLYVKPEYRNRGYGKAILKKLAQIAVERGCGRLGWSCLD